MKREAKPKNMWTEQEDKQLRALHDQGLLNSEIGRVLNRSEKSVSNRKCTLGLKRRRDLNKVIKG